MTERSWGRRAVTLGEVLVGGLVLAVALVAVTSLLLAHLGAHSGWGALGLGALATALLAGLVALRWRPAVAASGRELLALAAVGGVAAVFAFPGFPYDAADFDPGIYMSHAQAISRTGSYALDDPVLEAVVGAGLEVRLRGPSDGQARFSGVWVDDREAARVVPQFFHLYPATLATAHDIGGRRALVGATPALAVLSALALTLAVRRAAGQAAGPGTTGAGDRDPRAWSPAGWTAGILSGLLLATNMIQVWGAKHPGTELLAQLLFVGAALGAVVAVGTRWRPAAGAAGALAALVFLARPDGVLVALVAAGALAALAALRRWERCATWFAGGLLLGSSYAAVQAYGTAELYASRVHVPGWPRLLLALAALAAAAAAGRWLAGTAPGRRLLRALGDRSVQRRVGVAVAALAAVGVAVALLRPWIWGDVWDEVRGEMVRAHDERAMLRLTWFLTPLGVALAWAGLAVLAVRRWRPMPWAVVVTPVLLLPVYVFDPRIGARLMWWTRRFVTVALVGLVVLAAVALAAAIHRRRPGWGSRALQAGGVAAAVVLLGAFAAMSWPLRGHREYRGSFAVVDDLAAVADGEEAVFLFPEGEPAPLRKPHWIFAAPLWLGEGELAAMLPGRGEQRQVAAFQRHFDARDVYLVTDASGLPDRYPGDQYERVARITHTLPIWEVTRERRPEGPGEPLVVDLAVWRAR